MRFFSDRLVASLVVSFLVETFAGQTTQHSLTKSTKPFGVARNHALKLRGGEVIEVSTMADLESKILSASASGKLVIIDFSATWCGPCKMIAPIYSKLSDMYPNALFLKVDVDENPQAAAKYQVSAMPTFLFIKGGDVVDKIQGANQDALESMLSDLM